MSAIEASELNGAGQELDGPMRRAPDVVEYQGHERTIETLVWWCGLCGEATFTGQPLADHEKAFLELKAEVDGQRRGLDVTHVGSTLNSFFEAEGIKEEVDRRTQKKLRYMAADDPFLFALGSIAVTSNHP